MTHDNGKEIAKDSDIETKAGVPVYVAHSHSPRDGASTRTRTTCCAVSFQSDTTWVPYPKWRSMRWWIS